MIPTETGKDLLKYIPQRFPFVMVSELYSHSERAVISGFKIKEANVLVESGYLQEGGLVENMAQTAALFAGIHAQSAGQQAPLGYIASIKGLKINKLPAVEDMIYTSVEIVNEVMNMQIAMARIYDNSDQTIAACEMRIFIKSDED